MSFSYSAGVITQTGTETGTDQLSGLSGITGVTTTTTGARTVYSIDSSTRIIFEGTCVIDPRVCELETNNLGGSSIVVNGTLDLGLDISYIYGTQLTSGRALNIVGGSNKPWKAIFDVNGTLRWYGCEVDTASGISVNSGGTIKIRDGVFISRLGNHTIQQGNTVILQEGSTSDIVGLKKTLTGALAVDNSAINILGSFTTVSLSKIVSTGSISPDNRSSTLAPVPFATVSNFRRLQDRIAQCRTVLTKFIDCASWDTTSPVFLGLRTNFGTVTRYGQAEFYRNCNCKILYDGSGLQDVSLYWKDIDNGSRGVTTATEWGQTYNSFREYTATTDANGEFSTQILEAAFYNTNPTAPIGIAPAVDDRTESGHKITFSGYKYGYSAFTVQFQGNQTVAAEAIQPVIVDANITEATRSTVDAYVTLDNAEEFYDKAASYLQDNFGTYISLLVTRSGDTIDAGSYNVTIDATAGSTFAFDGSTITIKASTFTGNIATTGTFTLANGASVIGTVTDVSGTSSSTPFEIVGLVSGNIYIQDDTGTLFDYQTGVTGTYNAVAPLGSSGTWKVTVDSAGYIANKFTFIADGAGKNFSGILTQLTQPSGSPMYTGSSSALLSVVPVADGSKMLVRIGNGFVTAQEVFDEAEDALATTVGMEYLSNGGGRIELAVLPTGTFLFLKPNITDGIQMIRDSAPDASATVGAFISSTDGTVVDGSNGEIQFISSTGITAAAVKAEVDQALVDYDVDTKTNVKPSVSV